jgi:protein-L-isoaspartate(D-aspartate) O-methyltransferase
MVNYQIRARGIKDKQVIDAMLKVPRHLFVPKAHIKYSYRDHPIPIGYGQTISQPYIVALMTELLKLNKDDKVLEVGTGSGYQAAILSKIVKKVYTIEIVKELGISSKRRLSNYKNVFVKIGDGYKGWKAQAPYDAIIVTCAPEDIPKPLIEQLKVGGIMCIPVGKKHQIQKLYIVRKNKDKTLTVSTIADVRFVPLIRD